jgi:hypothetical protein
LLSLLELLHLLLEVQLLCLIEALRLTREITRGRYPFKKVLESRLGVCPRKACHACAQLPEACDVVHGEDTFHQTQLPDDTTLNV